ncbi:MAG: hypothetical protein QOI15_1184 [Pseudonocardiales bacterium]|nr:hypothetical protein [Pseudonocardiales bacterium]
MQPVAIDAALVAEGAVGGVVLGALLAIASLQLTRWWRRRRAAPVERAGTPALARFIDTESTDPASFGGGAWSARVIQRRDTVTYGYLAVVEEYASADSGGRWCTLTVSLPGRVPSLVVDNRAASGRVGVPLDMPAGASLDDPPFDATYIAGAVDGETIPRVLSAAAREVLVRAPVQRLMLHESQLLLRTFDGVLLDDELIRALDGVAARFLAATPSFVKVARAPAHSAAHAPGEEDPLPEGFYGPAADASV